MPQTGVVIVALPAADDPCQTVGPEQKHATLAYLGDIADLPDDGLATIQDAVRRWLDDPSAGGELAGCTVAVDRIDTLGDDGALVWMLADDGSLRGIRDALLTVEAVGDLDAEYNAHPDFTPHVTIGYPALEPPERQTGVTDEAVWAEPAAAITSITFDRLAVWAGTEQTEYPLIGTADPGRGSAREAHTGPGGSMPKQLHESTRLVEVAGGQPAAGTVPARKPIQIITPGWGSTGYYSPQVLERAATDRVIPKGTHMYLNHASESERTDRPERDVEKIAAVLTEDARWDGTRLLAEAELMGPHAELIEALAPYIGVSISGSATDITIGEAEGRKGPIIEGLAHVSSVDFVTHAGRGGMVLLESARPSLVNARAVENGVAESTANETRELLSGALREEFPGDKVWVWVRDFDDTTVWYEHETPDDCGTYALTYALSADGVVTFSGAPVEVRPETNYVPVPPGATTTRTEEAAPMGEDQAGETGSQTTADQGTAPAATETSSAPATAGDGSETATGTPPAADASPTNPSKEDEMSDTTPGAGAAPTQEAATAPTNPRAVMEARLNEQGREIRLLRAGQQAQSIVNGELADGWIAEATKARLARELTTEASLPLTESGELDEAELRVRTQARLTEAETEAAETLSMSGFGKVRGLGAVTESATTGGDRPDPYADSVSESFKQLGLSEAAVEIATKGR